MQNLCTFMTSSKRARGEWQGMANGIATRKDCETELDALFLATASLGNCEANDGDDDDDDGRITQSAWNFYSRSGGIHNKSALEVAALVAVVARFPLGSRPTNGARTAVAAGQAEARRGADIEAIAGIQPGASAATGDTQWTHNDNNSKNNSTCAVQHSVWCNNNKGGRGTGSGSGARACRRLPSLPSHTGEIAAQTGLKLLQCCRAIPAVIVCV